MPVQIDLPEDFTPDRLISVVRGLDKTLPRTQAIWLLSESDHPEKIEVLSKLLRDEQESPNIRHQAIMALYAANVREAPSILQESLARVQEPRVQASIAKALGRIGGPEALGELTTLARQSDGFIQAQANFAAALIAYRLNLPGHELKMPAADQLLKIAPRTKTRPMVVAQPDEEEAQLCLRSLANEPFGIELSRSSMYEIDCRPNHWMLVLNQEVSGTEDLRQLSQHKALAGLLAWKSEQTQRYSTAYVLLVTPQEPRSEVIDLLLVRPNGETAFAGTASVSREQLRFSIRAMDSPGIVAIALEGRYVGGKVEAVEAVSAERTQSGRIPKPA